MTHSNLTSLVMHSPNGYFPRAYGISKVTIHHMAGVMSAEQCGNVFASSARQASSNYGIGNGGEIACYVEEENAAWTSSSYWNDNQAITIEVSNSYAGDPWPISDAAWNAMIKLCADICKRYGITPSYTGDTDGTFTEHRMYASTACPGEYIHARMQQIVRDVKAAMQGEVTSWPVQSYQLNTTPAQKWKLIKQKDGTYEIVSVANGMALDVYGAGTKAGTIVQAYKRNNTKAQRWTIEKNPYYPGTSKGKYNPMDWAPYLIHPSCAPKLCLDVRGASKENGATIQIYTANNTNAQNWVIMDNGDGTWTFINVASGKALDLVGAGK